MYASLPDLTAAGRLPAADGFLVTIEGRTIKVLPIIDDPGRDSRSGQKVLWPEPPEMGYFKKRGVLRG